MESYVNTLRRRGWVNSFLDACSTLNKRKRTECHIFFKATHPWGRVFPPVPLSCSSSFALSPPFLLSFPPLSHVLSEYILEWVSPAGAFACLINSVKNKYMLVCVCLCQRLKCQCHICPPTFLFAFVLMWKQSTKAAAPNPDRWGLWRCHWWQIQSFITSFLCV